MRLSLVPGSLCSQPSTDLDLPGHPHLSFSALGPSRVGDPDLSSFRTSFPLLNGSVYP